MPGSLSPKPPARGAGCPPASALEALAAEPQGDAGAQRHVETCAGCRGYLSALRSEQARFLAARPRERFAAQVERRAAEEPPRGQKRLLFGGIMAGAAALAFIAVLREPRGGDITLKGGLVSIHLLRAGVERALGAGDALRPNDSLRFVLHPRRAGFAAVLERDGAGKVQVVAPFGASSPAPVHPGSTALPDSAVLDAAPGTESFFTVYSTEPFDLPALARQLEARGEASCPRCTVEVARFDKQP